MRPVAGAGNVGLLHRPRPGPAGPHAVSRPIVAAAGRVAAVETIHGGRSGVGARHPRQEPRFHVGRRDPVAAGRGTAPSRDALALDNRARPRGIVGSGRPRYVRCARRGRPDHPGQRALQSRRPVRHVRRPGGSRWRGVRGVPASETAPSSVPLRGPPRCSRSGAKGCS
jgi:hypothetical protein